MPSMSSPTGGGSRTLVPDWGADAVAAVNAATFTSVS